MICRSTRSQPGHCGYVRPWLPVKKDGAAGVAEVIPGWETSSVYHMTFKGAGTFAEQQRAETVTPVIRMPTRPGFRRSVQGSLGPGSVAVDDRGGRSQQLSV